MGFLDGIKQGIKSLLDKTTIDETIGGALNGFKNNVQQSADSFLQRTVPQVQQQASQVRDSAVNSMEDFWNKPPAPVAPIINTARTVANLTKRSADIGTDIGTKIRTRMDNAGGALPLIKQTASQFADEANREATQNMRTQKQLGVSPMSSMAFSSKAGSEKINKLFDKVTDKTKTLGPVSGDLTNLTNNIRGVYNFIAGGRANPEELAVVDKIKKGIKLNPQEMLIAQKIDEDYTTNQMMGSTGAEAKGGIVAAEDAAKGAVKPVVGAIEKNFTPISKFLENTGKPTKINPDELAGIAERQATGKGVGAGVASGEAPTLRPRSITSNGGTGVPDALTAETLPSITDTTNREIADGVRAKFQASVDNILPGSVEAAGPQLRPKVQTLDELVTGVAPQRELPRNPQTLNAERLALDEQGKNTVAALENNGVPRTVLPNADVAAMAENVNPRVNPITAEQTAAKTAKNVATRSQAVDDMVAFQNAKAAGASPEELKTLLSKAADSAQVARSVGTDAGRTLQAQKILAEESKSPMQKIFGLLDNAGVDKEKYLNDAVNVNWEDANSVTEFYRKHVPAKFGEWIDTLRYNSMLSSPNTHINNAFGNTVGSAVVAPIEKTITGGIDFLHSAVTGAPRKYSMGEGPAYVKGYWENVGNAALKFADTMSGKQANENLDMTGNLPLSAGTKGLKGFVAKNLELPMKLLEASDQFFTTLVQGGATKALEHRASKGIAVGDIAKKAEDEAAYRLFRQDVKSPDQGHVLDAIDSVTQLINKARQNKNPIVSTIAKFTLPFVKTPMNILKQGIEYSPAGITTLLGASNKTEQLSKAIFGTAVFTGAATMLGSGRLTWAAPTNKKEKDAFYASGMQPYAIKVGNNWVQYTKLPPSISFPMAMVAAIDDGLKTKKITQSTADAILSGISKYGNFFADQSYLKSIGDLVASVKGDPYAISSTIANYPQQFVPWRAMGGWMARLTDPNQRAVNTDAGYIEQQVQQLMMNIPGLSQAVPARTDLSGAPVENQNRVLNAFSPLKTTTERPDQKMIFDTMQEENKAASDQKILDKQAETNLDSIFGKGPSSEKEYKITGFAGGKVAGAEASNMPQLDDPKMKALASYYKLDEVNAMPEDTAFNKAKKQKAIFDTVDEVMKSKKMSDQEQSQFLAAATGLPPEKIDYYRVAKTTEDERYGFAVDTLTNLGKDSDPFQALTEMRQEVDGKMILTAGVIDSLVDDGLISLADGKALKKVKAAKGGGVTTSGGGGGGGGSKATKADQKALSALFDNKPKAQSYAFSKSITGLSNSKKNGKPSSSSIESILSKKRKTALSVKPPK